LDSTHFWQEVDDHSGDGTLVLFLFTTWKHVADYGGHQAIDILSGLFDVVCGLVSETATYKSPLSTTAYGAYWVHLGSEPATVDDLKLPFPITVSWATPQLTFTLECATSIIKRPRGESGEKLYRRAQEKLDQQVAQLPLDQHYGALPLSWPETSGRI
jgi:hypothetical protein